MKVRVIAALVLLLPLPARGQEPASAPPPDTPEVCATLSETKRRQTEACKTEEERREDAYRKRVQEREALEKPQHSSFLKNMHVDGMWMPTNGDGGLYGLIGTHVTIADINRVHFFGPPGVMLLLRDRGGSKHLQPGVTWGVSISVAEFRMPGTTHVARFYVNLVKCWTVGAYQERLDMVGGSLTWKK